MNDQNPLVSIIIPMRNEQKHVERFLTSIVNQDYPAECMEVLVIDGDSTDSSRALVLDFAARHHQNSIRLLQNPKRNVPAALNVGINAARGAIIVRLDAHITIANDYVSTCVRYLKEKKAANVGGLMRPQGMTYVGKAVALATSSPFGSGDSKFHYSEHEQYVDTVYLGSYWRKIFDEIGLYDETLLGNEDYELNYRIRQAGGKILLSPAIKSTYTPRSTLSALWRQYFWYGRWKMRMLQKHPESLRWRQIIPPIFVGAVVVSFCLGFFWSLGYWFFEMIVAAYLVANLSASIISARSGAWQFVPVLPLVFFCIHFGWGLGFWYRLLLMPVLIKLKVANETSTQY